MTPRRPGWLWLTAGLITIASALTLVKSSHVVSRVLHGGLEEMSGNALVGGLAPPILAILILGCEWCAVVGRSRSATRLMIGVAVYFLGLGVVPAVAGSLGLAGVLKAMPGHAGREVLIAAAVAWAVAVPVVLAHVRWLRLLSPASPEAPRPTLVAREAPPEHDEAGRLPEGTEAPHSSLVAREAPGGHDDSGRLPEATSA